MFWNNGIILRGGAHHNYFKNNLDIIPSPEIFSDGVEKEAIVTDF
jgi:hypothetical protein